MTRSLVAAAIALALGASPVAAEGLFGVAYQGSDAPASLYQVDPATAVSSLIGVIGFERVGGIDFDPTNGALYGAGKRADGTDTPVLLTIDPTTGAGAEVGPTGGVENQTDLSFDSGGNLFLFTDGPEVLNAVDKTTGSITTTNPTAPFEGLGNALAFDPSDVLRWAGGNDGDNSGAFSNILALDGTATNVATFAFPPPEDCPGAFFGGSPRVAAADYDPMTGEAFGVLKCGAGGVGGFDDRLVQVNFDSGALTEIGPFVDAGTQLQIPGFDALAFQEQPVSPE